VGGAGPNHVFDLSLAGWLGHRQRNDQYRQHKRRNRAHDQKRARAIMFDASAVLVLVLENSQLGIVIHITHYSPLTIILSILIVGAARRPRNRRSSPIISIPRSMSRKLPAIVTSSTGKASLPSSTHQPEAPREKSPVTALKPKPIISVT